MSGIVAFLAVIGVAGIVAGIYSLFAAARMSREVSVPKQWRLLRIGALVTGIALGGAAWVWTAWMGYPIKTAEGIGHVVGVPFFTGFFDAAGRDYVGRLTIPAAVGNTLFWFLMPQVALTAWVVLWRKRTTRS